MELNMVRPAWVGVAFLAGCVIAAVIMQLAAVPAAKKAIRDEAVRENHARYKVVDEHGTTKFEWLPAPKTTYHVVDPQGNTEFEGVPKATPPAPVPGKP